MEIIKLIDKGIESREKALNRQIEMLDAILFELKKDNPNLGPCLSALEAIKQYTKNRLAHPDLLTIIRDNIENENKNENHGKIKRSH